MESSSSSSSSSGFDLQQLSDRWATLLSRLQEDPKVARVLNSRVGQYLGSHPFVAFSVVLFGAMAAVPCGLFLTFALVTIIMSAVGFVFFEAFLLFVGGLTLLCVVTGIAVFSVTVSLIVNVVYIASTTVLKRYNRNRSTGASSQERDNDGETSTSSKAL